MSSVLWTDVAPRDGMQNLDVEVATDVKVRLVQGLLDAGVPRVEATSFVSPERVPQLADAADVIDKLGADALPRLRVLIPNLRGLELALSHGVRNVLLTVGATDTFNRRNVNRDVDASLADLTAIVREADTAGCVVDVSISVAFGCPFEGVVTPDRVLAVVAAAVDRGATEVGIADTIGVATPADVTRRVGLCRAAVPGGRLALHVHDTRGQGVANVLAAYAAGVTRFDGSVGGIGGCPFAPHSTGNVCSEDALLALHALGAETGCNLDSYVGVARRLGDDLKRTLPGSLHRAGMWAVQQVGDQEPAATA